MDLIEFPFIGWSFHLAKFAKTTFSCHITSRINLFKKKKKKNRGGVETSFFGNLLEKNSGTTHVS